MGIATTSALGAASIAIIGAANIVGTLAAGWLGKWYSKKYLLALIYTGRTVAAALFILFPVTPATVIVFRSLWEPSGLPQSLLQVDWSLTFTVSVTWVLCMESCSSATSLGVFRSLAGRTDV